MFEALDSLLDHFLAEGIPGYDCIVYQNGAPIYRRTKGVSDREAQTPMRGDERFNIYSCSKPITCTAALQLAERGLFRLDDPLSAYMPEFAEMTVRTETGLRKAARPITIRNLFTMTAGFSYNTSSPSLRRVAAQTDGRCPTVETMRALAAEPLLFDPGDRWEYSLCHDVLAALVEVVSGQRYGAYVAEHIFAPLGMTHSTFLLPDAELDTVAAQYKGVDGGIQNCGKQIQPYKLGSEFESGGAGCVSTLEDYIRFLEGLRTGALLRPETRAAMIANQLSPQAAESYWHAARYGYGLGVRCPKPGCSTDFGWGGAAGAVLAIDLAAGMSLFYVQHVLNPPNNSKKLDIVNTALAALR